VDAPWQVPMDAPALNRIGYALVQVGTGRDLSLLRSPNNRSVSSEVINSAMSKSAFPRVCARAAQSASVYDVEASRSVQR